MFIFYFSFYDILLYLVSISKIISNKQINKQTNNRYSNWKTTK